MKENKPTTERYTLADLEKWREVAGNIDPPIRLAVLGDPVAHSLSPQIQNAALRACGIEAQYARFHIRANELRSALCLLRDLNFVGVNLTVPHKIAAFAQIDQADESASRVGAVNTILLRDKKLILVLVNRTHEKAAALAERLRAYFAGPRVLGPAARLEAVEWEEVALRAQLADVDLIVNATPLGMNPSDPSPIPARLLAPHHMVFDAVYGPSKTSLLRAADEAGARGVNGLSMLLHQGALAFQTWFDREAPIDVMRAVL